MKHLFVLFVSVFIISSPVFAKQEKYIRHRVEQGETITQIAKRYGVTPFDIYRLNPDTKNGIQENTIVLIPKRLGDKESLIPQKKEEGTVSTTHKVVSKETLFGIAKKYNISVLSLEKANAAIVKDGLKTGQTLIIPTKGATKSEISKPINSKREQFVLHEVQSKETKYGIAKKYGITVQELEKQNPEILNNLRSGLTIKIPVKNTNTPELAQVVDKESKIEQKKENEQLKEDKEEDEKYTNYEVQPKETLYSLTKLFQISENDLVALNPELIKGLKECMILKVPVLLTEKEPIPIRIPKEYKNLTSKIHNEQRKELVMLLPFNLLKSNDDSTIDIDPKNKMLNMTLDFYSGALMAIDSARILGVNVNIRIFDSEETKNSSDVAKIISSNDFSKVDVVIGPFYQSNVEITAGLLKEYNTPVISPMSKESSNLHSNLYQSIPASDFLKLAMLNYIKTKESNVIAVIDPKKSSVKQFIANNYPEVRFVPVEENGIVIAENLEEMLLEGKNNFVIIETERAGLILSTTDILLKKLPDCSIKLATLEKNKSFEYEEISSTRLMKLNLHYPSMSRDVDSPEINSFANSYKKKNNIYPNQYAIRGFDVTFDALIRLSQKENFADTADNIATEQVGSRFEYQKQSTGGYINEGIYIFNYNDDLNLIIKEINL